MEASANGYATRSRETCPDDDQRPGCGSRHGSTTLGRNILPLERDGLIAVEKGSRDCRSKALLLIEAGEVRFQGGREGMGASAKAVLGGLRRQAHYWPGPIAPGAGATRWHHPARKCPRPIAADEDRHSRASFRLFAVPELSLEYPVSKAPRYSWLRSAIRPCPIRPRTQGARALRPGEDPDPYRDFSRLR